MSEGCRCLNVPKCLLAAALGFASLFFVGAAWAQGTPSSVQTPDKGHVAGEVVLIVARGFVAGENVDLQVTHAGGTAEPGMGHETWTVMAGAGRHFHPKRDV